MTDEHGAQDQERQGLTDQDINHEIKVQLKTKLNPASGEFDRQYWHDEIELAGQLLQTMAESVRDSVSPGMEVIKEFYRSGRWEEFKRVLETLADALQKYEKDMPYIEQELQKPEYDGKTIIDLIAEDTDDDGKPLPGSLLVRVLKAARAAKRKGQKLRTVSKAGDVSRISFDKLALPTAADYVNAVSLNENGFAYMSPVTMDGLNFEDGKLYFKNDAARAVSEMQLKDLKTKANIQSINLPFLQFYYTHLFSEWENTVRKKVLGDDVSINPVTKFYLPDIARARGLSKNTSAESMEAIKDDIASFHNIVGVCRENGRAPSYYPVLNFEGYDAKTNTISMSSPYLLHVVDSIYRVSIRTDKNGKPKLRTDGTPQTKAVNSFLIHTDIMKERNKTAVQNVFIIVQGLERAGKHEYHISAQTIIDRNPLFQQQLRENQNKRRLIQKNFRKTLELLRTRTDLQKVYQNIVLPDPAVVPMSEKDLSDFVFRIHHDGKVKGGDGER